MFSVTDQDMDGKITREELKDALTKAMGLGAWKMESSQIEDLIKSVFEELDTDRSGFVTLTELRTAVQATPSLAKIFALK
jgi:Ca2+-binding EF-hand superfamily protein